MSTETFSPSRRLDPWTRWAAFIGLFFLLLAAAVTVADVLMRWLFNAPIDGWDDLSHLVIAVVIVSCFPAGLLQGHNITIRFLGAACGRRASNWLEMFGALLTLIFFFFVAWQFVVMTVDLHETNDTTMTVNIITWPWWTVATLVVIFCVPVQAVVFYGHVVRARAGDGPGGLVEAGSLDDVLGGDTPRHPDGT